MQPGYPPVRPGYPWTPPTGHPPPGGPPPEHPQMSMPMPMQPSYPMYPPGPAAPLQLPAPAPLAQQLTAPVVVAGPQFSLPYMTKLTMKGKNFMKLTAGNFEVYDPEKKLVLKVKGTFGLGTRRVLTDFNNNPTMTLKKKFITTRGRWEAYRGKSINDNNKIFSVRAANIIQFMEKYNVFMAGNTGENAPDFRVKGGFLDRSCQIFLGNSDILIARMDEKYNAKTIILGKDIFGIQIEPNVDYALVIAIILVVNELDKSGQSSLGEGEEDEDGVSSSSDDD